MSKNVTAHRIYSYKHMLIDFVKPSMDLSWTTMPNSIYLNGRPILEAGHYAALHSVIPAMHKTQIAPTSRKISHQQTTISINVYLG